MDFSIATLLSNFTDDKLVAPKVLEKKLGYQDETSVRRLQIALDALEKIGILVKERGRYRRVYEEDVVEAKLRCSSKGFCFAIQDSEDAEDIYIRESHLSNAWNGDRVLVRVLKEGSRRRSPEGEVRLILERANPSVLARVKQTDTGYRAVPLDDRLLFELNLEPNGDNLESALDNLVHVEVRRYPLASRPPIGRVARILGSDAEAAADTDIVCCKHDLRRFFSSEVLEAALALSSKNLLPPDLEQRLDLRHLLTISFSPYELGDKRIRRDGEMGGEVETSWQDVSTEEKQTFFSPERSPISPPTPVPPVENALTLEKKEGGRWRLGIHIADVASYIEPDSLLDQEARKRGTTVYLGGTVLPLLPDAVADSCSLLTGKDRKTVSVLLTLDGAGQTEEFEIQPTIIHVDHQLSYEQAQSIISRGTGTQHFIGDSVGAGLPVSSRSHPDAYKPAPTSAIPEPVLEMVRYLFLELSPLVKEQRQQRGAFELNLQEDQLPLPDEGRLGAIQVEDSQIVRSLLTELMLLANVAVASQMQALLIPGIYCVQSAPDPVDIEDLMKLASNLGLDLYLKQEETVVSSDFKRFTEMFAKSSAPRVLNYLLKSTLKSVSYSSTPGPHFGLALNSGYTHCLAPQQRYVDLLVQRILHAIFEKGRDRRTTRAKESVNLRHSSALGKINWNVLPPDVLEDLETRVSSSITHLNDREKVAADAEADLEGLKKAEMMKERTGEVFQGLITGVQSYGFFVEIEDLLVEGLVHVSSLKDDWYEFRSRHCCLVGRKSRVSYRLGDRVEVQVKSVDYYRQQIDLVTVGGGSEASHEDMDADE